MVIVGVVFWGLLGIVVQYLFEISNVLVEWFVIVCLFLFSLFLLMILFVGKNRCVVWEIWKDKKLVIQLIVFGIVGMLGVQYIFLVLIGIGNVVVVMFFQYLVFVMIVLFMFVIWKNFFQLVDICVFVLVLGGIFLLLINGSINNLIVLFLFVIWGLFFVVVFVFYMLYFSFFLKKWGFVFVIGWGMLIGGIGMSFIYLLWDVDVQGWMIFENVLVGFIVIFGMLLGFYMYLISLKYLFL